jgi:hypothetical protein
MLEKYRVLGAMAALREFTVADLARFSDVKARTVQTVLDRNKNLREEIGRESTGRRGGSYVRYRLAPDAETELISKLRTLESVGAIHRPKSAEASSKLPNELVAAEYTVLTEFPAADSSDDRRRLLSLARSSLDDVRDDTSLDQAQDLQVEAHCRILDFLIRLSEQELAAQDDVKLRPPWSQLFGEFVSLSLSVQLTDKRIIEQVQTRLLESPLNPSREGRRRVGARTSVIVVTDAEQNAATSTRGVAAVIEEEIGDDRIDVTSMDIDSELAEATFEVPDLCVFSLVAARQAGWSRALGVMQAARRAGCEVVVFADRWEPTLANQVQERQATYVPLEGLSREGVVGAICQHLPAAGLRCL